MVKKDTYIKIDFKNYKSLIIILLLIGIIILLIVQKEPIKFYITQEVTEDKCICECIVEHKEACDWNVTFYDKIYWINHSWEDIWEQVKDNECKTCWS